MYSVFRRCNLKYADKRNASIFVTKNAFMFVAFQLIEMRNALTSGFSKKSPVDRDDGVANVSQRIGLSARVFSKNCFVSRPAVGYKFFV